MEEKKESSFLFVGSNGQTIPARDVNILEYGWIEGDKNIYIIQCNDNKIFIENIDNIKKVFVCGDVLFIDCGLDNYFQISFYEEEAKKNIVKDKLASISILNEKKDDIIKTVTKELIVL